MSELITVCTAHATIRRQLLSTVSALTLLTAVSTGAIAEEVSHPSVWLELGGQLERVDGGQERFIPPFASELLDSSLPQPTTIQRSPRFAVGGEGKISFEPGASNWVFSIGVRYGRSNNAGSLHGETSPASAHYTSSVPILGRHNTGFIAPLSRKSIDGAARNDESHAVIDFRAGKDVGLGLFGSGSQSLVSLGVRFAQFASRSSATINANPDFQFSYKYVTQVTGFPFPVKINLPRQLWHLYGATIDTTRNFHGVGPSVAWDANVPIIGNKDIAEVTFDWGVNAAVLFGRQKVGSHHQTTAFYRSTAHNSVNGPLETVYQSPHNVTRTRSVIVPNVGGFAGLSLKFPNAKLSLGYRGDFFFGAMDGGIDARKTYDRDFYGPFATISIGLGG